MRTADFQNGRTRRAEKYRVLKKLRAAHCSFKNLPEKRASRWGESLTAEKIEGIPMGQTDAGLPGGVRPVDRCRTPAALHFRRHARRQKARRGGSRNLSLAVELFQRLILLTYADYNPGPLNCQPALPGHDADGRSDSCGGGPPHTGPIPRSRAALSSTPLTSTAMESPSALWHRGSPVTALKSCLRRRCASLYLTREARDCTQIESEPLAMRASVASAWT
jgi:hypothetical protein